MSEEPPVLIERRASLLLITLNRPDARNAVNAAMAEGIAAALEELDGEPELRSGVLTGAGKGFCAGMDLKAFARGERPHVEGRGFAGIVQGRPRKPLIAAVEGFALAGGLEVAIACDLIVAAGGALLRLPRLIPYHAAMEMALTGEPISAERAAELGLVNRLADPGAAVEVALELAQLVAAGGPLAVEAAKRIVVESAGWSESEAWERQAQIAGPVFTSEDAREGAVAFAEKRAPTWKGR